MLIVDRSAPRLLAVLGIAGWLRWRAILAADQFRLMDGIR